MEYERLRSLQRIHRKKIIKNKFNRSILILLSRSTFYLFILFLLIIGIQEGTQLILNYLQTSTFFALKNIEVQGVNRLTEAEVIGLVDLEKNINILTIKLNEVDQRVRKNPWVKSIRLRRILPGILRITIQEKVAFAIVQDEVPYIVNRKSEIIKIASPGEEINLPVITGLRAKDPLQISNGLHLIQNPITQKVIPLSQIGEAHFDENRLTIYTISPRMKILADTRLLKDQFYRLKLVLHASQKRGTLPSQIDLNYSKKVVVKLNKSQYPF